MPIDIEAPGADEADLKAAIQALANEIVVVTLSVSTTLDSTYYSKLTEVDTAAVVITFPTAPATEQTLDVINTSAGNITVNGLTVAAGKTVGHISIGSAWEEISPNVAAGGSFDADDARAALGAVPYVSGRWYLPANYENFLSGASGGAVASTSTMYFAPILFRDGLTIDSIAVGVATSSAAGNFQLHLYAIDPATFLPTGTPVWSSGNQSTNSATTVTIGSLSVAVTAGWYWLAVMVDNTTAVFIAAGNNTGAQPNLVMPLAGADTAAISLSSNPPTRQFTKTGITFGTPPTMTGNQTTDGLAFSATSLRVPAITFKGA